MTHCVKTFLAAALVAAAFVSRAHAETPEEEIRRAISQLGNDDQKARDNAEQLLTQIGPEAVLFYRPDDQGADPEIRHRMEELMSSWEFAPEPGQSIAGTVPRLRVRPWIPLEDLRELPGTTEDDRLPAFLEREFVKDHPGEERSFLARSDIPLYLGLMRAALSRSGSGIFRSLAIRECLDMSEESRRLLLDALHSPELTDVTLRSLLLWRLGEPEQLLADLRGGRVGLEAEYNVLAPDVNFRRAVGEAFKTNPDRAHAATRFPSDTFADYYLGAEDSNSLAELSPDAAVPRLRALLKSKTTSVRFKAALRLAAFGEASEELGLWAVPESWQGSGWPGDIIARAALLIPGDRVEQTLRTVADDRPVKPDEVLAALRGLAARKRERDITFIYGHLKDLPPEFQPEVAVDLARLGSAAGANMLIPRLYGTGYALRRDANNALKKITGQDFGYNPAGTLPERCRAARKWAAWWKANKTSFQPDVK